MTVEKHKSYKYFGDTVFCIKRQEHMVYVCRINGNGIVWCEFWIHYNDLQND